MRQCLDSREAASTKDQFLVPFGLTIGLSDVGMEACLQCDSKFSAVPETNHLLHFRFCIDAAVREAAEVDVRRLRDENVVSIRHPSAKHLFLEAQFSSYYESLVN